VRTVRSKGERVVADALQQIQLALPFHLAGIHSDNGSEFINHHLLRWCNTWQITFTRGRPNHKNDNAHVEQKNWAFVRRCAGYFRYDTPREQRLLDEMWQLESVLFNLFSAQQKLISKTRVGAKVTKRYDIARTPADRLLNDYNLVTDQDRAAIQALLQETNPAALRRRIGDIQSKLIYLAAAAQSNHNPTGTTSTTAVPKSKTPRRSGHFPMSQRILLTGHLDMSHQDQVSPLKRRYCSARSWSAMRPGGRSTSS
jgi:hypothetical protein